jgi:outer membrane protein
MRFPARPRCQQTTVMHRSFRIVIALLVFAGICIPGLAAAQGTCKAVSPDCVIVGEWDLSVSLGAGARTNPVAGRSDIPLIVIPQVSYYGKRFFLESLEPGYTLHEGDAHTINVVATPGYDRVFFSRSDLQNVFVSGTGGSAGGAISDPPLPDAAFPGHRRRTTYLMGPEWLFNYGRWVGQASALHEITGRHDGYELRAAVATPLIQTDHSLVANAGWTWKDAATVDYYYGVRGLYRPGAAFNPFVKLAYTRPLTQRWTLNAFVHYEYLGGSIADSPIVSDRSAVTAFAGFNFKVL